MEVSIVKVGNSRGIRIPKKVLEQYAMDERVEMVLSEEGIVLKPLRAVRQGWDNAFAQAASSGDDELLIDDVFADEDLSEEGDWKGAQW